VLALTRVLHEACLSEDLACSAPLDSGRPTPLGGIEERVPDPAPRGRPALPPASAPSPSAVGTGDHAGITRGRAELLAGNEPSTVF
jgi:hypothetical protein